MPKLYLKLVNPLKGTGVFAAEMIKKGEMIEECGIILIPKEQVEILQTTVLKEYLVTRSQEDGTCAIALGHGSLYNHSSLPNAMVVKNSDTNTLIIRSLCEIKKDEEICVDYLSHSNVEELRFKEI